MNNQVRTFFLFISFCFLFFITSCIIDDEPKGANIGLQDKLPQFTVTLNNGEIINTQNLYGKAGLIMFFNTNCPDCQKELPVVQELWDLYKEDKGISIILIAREEGYNEIEKYWKEHNLTMFFSPQDDRKIFSLFARSIIPRIYIYNKEGTIVFMSGDEDLPTLKLLKETLEAQK